MSWIWLAVAIAGDVVGTTAMERGSRAHYARSLESIPTSAADAIYFAASTAIIVVVGVVVLKHRLTARKAVGLLLVVAGVVALRLEAAGV